MVGTEKIVTFLIGNGFDVGMGMRSQYKDFYQEYTKTNGPYVPQEGTYLKEQIKRNLEENQKKNANSTEDDHWSYYEKWFGELTKKRNWNGQMTPEKLLELNEEFQALFYEYLKEQEKGLIFSLPSSESRQKLRKKLGQTVLDALKNFYDKKYIGEGFQKIQEVLKEGDPIRYQFVCFNYSGVLDECVKAAIEQEELRKKQIDIIVGRARSAYENGGDLALSDDEKALFVNSGDSEFIWKVNLYKRAGLFKRLQSYLEENIKDEVRTERSVVIGNVHHGHGALKEPEETVLVMGVNDELQSGAELRESQSEERRDRMVKRYIMIGHEKREQLDKTVQMIRESAVIVVYGMSVGDTDRYYWEELYNWLNEDQKRQLIFYLYDGAFSPYNPNHRPRICGEYRELFREMTWKIDEKMKRCTVNNQNIYFLKGQCPKHNCGKTKCSSEELKDSCKNFLKGSVTKKCQEKNCPYNKVRSGTDPHNCTSWHEIRRRIHFAIQKNIFAMDLVKRNYYPAMMYDFILRGILREDEKGAWFLEDRKIAVMDPITVNNVRAAAAARAGFKLYYLYTQLQKKVTPADFEEVLKKTGTPLDPSADAYKKYISWLTQEEETLKEKGAELKTPKITEQNQEQYWDATEQFVKVLKNGDHIYKEEEARKIADFYTGIRNWRKLS